jgi:iron-sulfur cluster repair protein YtfE (RIC family)
MGIVSWSTPHQPLTGPMARQRILRQHERIRALLAKARDVAEAALDGNPSSPDAVASAVGDVRTTIEVHLSFEETVLVPLFRREYADGPQRAQRLTDEHKRQREVLASVHREATAFPTLPMLAAKLAFLTSWLLTDMDEEERTVLPSLV